ncbi:MAG: electron transfer flavoprotein subunit beta/FixA family protein [Bacteroidales bacterium]|nr:electron transfer flavoprotein subunit beta/FixA family protein [Candidatus Colimorpha onthohippi]
MKIVVCIKQVPDTTEVKINPVTGTLIREGVPSIMNPDDKGGLEYALQLKDQYGAHVTVITMGLPQAEAVLREALAMGADRAILLTDRKLGGADTLATSSALAGALRTMEYDLIITGRQAIDGDTAQVGPQIADMLDLPQITYVESLQYDPAYQSLTVRKHTEDGYQMLQVQTPCLLTALASAVQPRYMSVRGIMTAYDKEVEVWGADRIDVPEDRIGKVGSPTSVFKAFPKELKAAGETVECTPEEAVELIISKLKEKHLI